MKNKQTPKKDPKDLRYGYTTGANAAAAAKAAVLSLATQSKVMQVDITLPIGKRVSFQMKDITFDTQSAQASIVKDAGDDPDATHLAEIIATVKWHDDLRIDGGIGVGRVTKTGLPVPVGEAAINPVPRKMITEAVKDVLGETKHHGAEIIISVPEGETIAEQTMNARLGIVGGISILGTRGTVVPFSTAAFKASIAQAVSVASTSSCDHIILSTGGRSEKYAMTLFPDLQQEAFVEMGDFVGFSLKQVKAKKCKRATLVGMMGKFSKVAQGIMMVHSKSAPVDFGFLKDIAKQAGADEVLLEKVEQANTATEAGNVMKDAELDEFFTLLAQRAAIAGYEHIGGGIEVEVVLMTMKNELLAQTVYKGPGKENARCEI
ncbi:cobalt-precorrin-5B (C1)-methyltransferase [Alteribacillus persepolensis]|uniref:Cobalt-precorrin-5B C(1)-methyltransferase n=1 Tax=Alteribacillus persepolensis TaxID=568899 RepID=A0A1G7Z529_9BACI|nr:cobalt-precorrin-5B (C(1))-methyltransferase [Alteribacillus persepolensis]SDH03882.1 cobalt-precorrin-5B (C1)-methyltransferase [Alteribacillus persepolensis]